MEKRVKTAQVRGAAPRSENNPRELVAQLRSGNVSSEDVHRLIRTQARLGGYLEAWTPGAAGAERFMKLLRAAARHSDVHRLGRLSLRRRRSEKSCFRNGSR